MELSDLAAVKQEVLRLFELVVNYIILGATAIKYYWIM